MLFCADEFNNNNNKKSPGEGAKSCSHLKQLDPAAESGAHIIDPDGKGKLAPFDVICNMTDKNGTGVTVISHDSENRTLVDGCAETWCYSRDINYIGVNLSQLAMLTRVSAHCEQFIKYECYRCRLLVPSHDPRGWRVSRDSNTMMYWGEVGNANAGWINQVLVAKKIAIVTQMTQSGLKTVVCLLIRPLFQSNSLD